MRAAAKITAPAAESPDGESWDAIVEPRKHESVKFAALGCVVDFFFQLLTDMKAGRDRQVLALSARIEALEERPTVEYKGVYMDGGKYLAGQLVTRQGGLWCCMGDTIGAPGVDHPHWKLVVKAGRA